MILAHRRLTIPVFFLAASATLAQPCEPHWSDEFSYGGIGRDWEGQVYSLSVFDDDGPGPRLAGLYAGFDRQRAGGLPANGIARWDGRRWSALAEGLEGDVRSAALALAVFDEDGDGPAMPALVAGGDFITAGGQPAPGIARWDGSAWSPVAGGIAGTDDPSVNALQVFDEDGPGPGSPVLIAAGSFTHAGGAPAKFIARWNGSSWSSLSTGLDKVVYDLEVFDEDGPGPQFKTLFACGEFQNAGGRTVNRLGEWNGQAWEKWESEINHTVARMAVVDHDGDGPLPSVLYIGGEFWDIGGKAFGRIACWNGQVWSDLAGGVDKEVTALAPFDLDGAGPLPQVLIASGPFEKAGGEPVDRVGAWDGQSWSEVDGGVAGEVLALAPFDPDGPGPEPEVLAAGGAFTGAGRSKANGIAVLEGGTWGGLGGGMDASVVDLLAFDDDRGGPNGPALFAGGRFGTAGGVPALRVARWNGEAWTALDGGVDWSQVDALGAFDDDDGGPVPRALYAGGVQNGSDVLARWDGITWKVRAVLNFDIDVLLPFDEDGPGPGASALFIGGRFNYNESYGIARWNGQTLSGVGGGVGGDGQGDAVLALAVFDPDGPGPQPAGLVAGGGFHRAGGIEAQAVARWDGAAWSPMGSGLLGGLVDALEVVDHDGEGPSPPTLYAAGSFEQTGLGEPARSVALWDGLEWRPLDDQLHENSWAFDIAGFDPDGAGPAPADLYAGGYVGAPGSDFIARYDGVAWSDVAGGMDHDVRALVVFNNGQGPGLYVGGQFNRAGDQSAGFIARLLCPVGTCPADCDATGSLDIADWLCFLALFSTADPAADCDASGALDLFDFLCFVNAFNGGC